MITTTVGNYPKVAAGAYGTTLIGTLTRWQRKEVSDAQLEQTCRDITRAVIQEQQEAGLDLVTDGQIRWEDLLTPVARRLEGFEINGLSRWFNNNTYYRRPILHKVPAYRAPILVQEYKTAAAVARKPLKAVLPGPYTFACMSEDRHYKRLRPFVMKMAELLNAEARALADAGAPIIQFDEPSIGFGKTDIRLAVEALNATTKAVNAKTAVITYFGSLDGLLEPLLRAKVDIVGVDVVSEPKTLAALMRAKVGKEIGLGCLDARNTKLETVAELHAIFNVVTKRVPANRLHVMPNCGLEFLPHAQALAKIRRLAEAVRTYRNAKRSA